MPIGPGGISSKMIRPKSVYSTMINVDDLESIQTKTGALTVNGDSTFSTGGKLRSGQTAYDTGTGFYLDYNAGTPRLSLGNSAGSKITWDGTTLAVTGTITATTGTIGGWTIGATALTATNISLTSGAANTARVEVGSGSNIGGVNSANGGTDITFWSGATHTNRATAPFRVSAAGAITSTSGTIGGLTVNTSDLTVGSGVKIKFGTSAGDYLDNNLIHFEVTGSEVGKIEFKAGANTTYGQVAGAASATLGYVSLIGQYDSGKRTSIALHGTSTGGLSYLTTGFSGTIHADTNGSATSTTAVNTLGATTANGVTGWNAEASTTAASSKLEAFLNSNTVLSIATTNQALSISGRLYPGTGSATQSTTWIDTTLGWMNVYLGDAAGAKYFSVFDSGLTQVFAIDSNGILTIYGGDTTAVGTAYGRYPVNIPGVGTKYIELRNA